MPPFHIVRAAAPEDVAAVAGLFGEYTDGLGIDLSYQSFADELASLPGQYGPPDGVLLLARAREEGGAVLGCVGLRRLPESSSSLPSSSATFELKRLYVRTAARDTGLGEALVRAALQVAVERRYATAVMVTLPTMASALRLYARLGFEPTEAYYATPIAETVFLRLDLEEYARGLA